jgi:hypothetical protein
MGFVLIFLTITILIIQFLLAFASILAHRNIEKKYNFILSEGYAAATALEYYVRIFGEIDVNVDAPITETAVAEEGYILLNKKKMYDTDLYTNLYLLFQLELTNKKYNFLRNLYVWHNVLFFLQIITLITFFFIPEDFQFYLAVATLTIQSINILLSIWSVDMYTKILDEAQIKAADLFNFDNIDDARAEQLANELRYRAFDYPLDVVWKFVRFLLPG